MTERDPSSRDPMLEMFIFESGQLVEQLEALLLGIERVACLTPAAVNEIFRIMHTIKGSAAMMAFDEISLLAHALEDLFDALRTDRPATVDCSRLNDHVLQGIDFIKAEVAKIDSGLESDGKAGALIERVRRFRDELSTPAGPITEPLPLQQPARYVARIFFEDGCQMENLRAYTVISSLQPHVVDLAWLPDDILDDERSADTIRDQGFQVCFTSHADSEAILALLEQTMFLDRLEFDPVEAFPAGILESPADPASAAHPGSIPDAGSTVPGVNPGPSNAGPGADSGPGNAGPGDRFPEPVLHPVQGKQQSLVSVSISKLDQLMDLVGELVISEAMLTRSPDLAGLKLTRFEKAARQLHKLTGELQDVVMSIRMVPIAGTYHKMQRLVRDMARKLGKDVALTLIGEETEVDKSIIDSLAEPLMHLIRNSLDHGIESPAERLAAGKPAQGSLRLEARNAGSDVWITIRDDGRGLNRDRILQVARERRLLARAESEYTEKDIFAFIMLPGFSTRSDVSEFSGRGVGMDVVRESIARVGGSLMIDSQPGAGTTFTIRIPLTLAIIGGMQIAVGASSFIVPITAIRESFRTNGQQMMVDMNGNEMMMYRGACANVVRLHRRFDIPAAVTEPDQGIMVVVEDEGRNCCLFADRLVGEQQVVVKPLPPLVKQTPGLAGCTILGDGGISLILDIGALVSG